MQRYATVKNQIVLNSIQLDNVIMKIADARLNMQTNLALCNVVKMFSSVNYFRVNPFFFTAHYNGCRMMPLKK